MRGNAALSKVPKNPQPGFLSPRQTFIPTPTLRRRSQHRTHHQNVMQLMQLVLASRGADRVQVGKVRRAVDSVAPEIIPQRLADRQVAGEIADKNSTLLFGCPCLLNVLARLFGVLVSNGNGLGLRLRARGSIRPGRKPTCGSAINTQQGVDSKPPHQ